VIFQSVLFERIIIVCLTQTWPIIYLLVFAYKLLKRVRNTSTTTLSSFFIMYAIGNIFSLLSIFLLFTPFGYFFYLMTYFCFIYSPSFIVIFSWLLVNLDKKISYNKYYMLIFSYTIAMMYTFWFGFLLEGIRYDSSTGWIPVFSSQFFIFSWSYLTIALILPQMYLTRKLLLVFGGEKLNNRIKNFIIGVFLNFLIIYLLVLYNTWIINNLFRIMTIIFNFIAGPLSGFLIYRGFGKDLG
jgi:hypothetical protein